MSNCPSYLINRDGIAIRNPIEIILSTQGPTFGRYGHVASRIYVGDGPYPVIKYKTLDNGEWGSYREEEDRFIIMTLSDLHHIPYDIPDEDQLRRILNARHRARQKVIK